MSERQPEIVRSVMDTTEAQLSLAELMSLARIKLDYTASSAEELDTIMRRLYDEVEVHQYCQTGVSTQLLVEVADMIEELSGAISRKVSSSR